MEDPQIEAIKADYLAYREQSEELQRQANVAAERAERLQGQSNVAAVQAKTLEDVLVKLGVDPAQLVNAGQ
jgi:hypothetical protein